jgi:hypothetical protein
MNGDLSGWSCTCLDGSCLHCNGRGFVPCTVAAGHLGGACPLCGGTGQRQCEWCYGTGRHALCGGTGVIGAPARGGIEEGPAVAPPAGQMGDSMGQEQ